MSRRFRHVQTGGTFDRLHDGHELVLNGAFEAGDFVTIGVTSDDLVSDKELSDMIQTFEERTAALRAWVDQRYGSDRYKIVVNEGVYNDNILDPTLEAVILVTKTLHHGPNINALRVKHGLDPVAFVRAPSSQTSSSTLRREEYIAKHGREPEPHTKGSAKVDRFKV